MRRRLVHGIYSQSFSQLSRLIVRLLEVPIFLRFWGVELYGEWLIISVIPSYLALSDLGFAQASNRQMTMLVAGGDRNQALSIFQTGAFMSLCLSVVLSAVFVVVLYTLTEFGSLNFHSIGQAHALIICGVLTFYAIASLQSETLLGTLQSEGRYPLGIAVLALMNIASFVAIAIVLLLGGNPVQAAITTTVVQWCGFAVLKFLSWRIAPWASFGIRHMSRDSLSLLLKPSVALMSFPLGNVLSNDGLRFLVGYALGPVAVVILTTHTRLARLVGVAGNLSFPFYAEMGLAYGKGEKALFSKVAALNAQAFFIAALALGVCVIVASPFVFPIWVEAKIRLDMALLIILVLAIFAETLWRTALGAALSTNRHVSVAFWYTMISVALIPIAYELSTWWGIDGVSWALLLANTATLAFCAASFSALVGTSFFSAILQSVIFPHRVVRAVLAGLANHD